MPTETPTTPSKDRDEAPKAPTHINQDPILNDLLSTAITQVQSVLDDRDTQDANNQDNNQNPLS